MSLEPWALDEQRLWRHVNTFGGFRWPTPPLEAFADERAAEQPMRVGEALDEIEWLLDNGMSAANALEQIGRPMESLIKGAERRGRYELAMRIRRATETEWSRRWGGMSNPGINRKKAS
jgi:hypothetical protein